ncbi:MAG: 3-deoxy-manno-octulosonate cytidylyltransferase [Sutterellaceae bacterium]|nr:3-deoxy-manno-octulosonate cytidylyltransferase [Burkholderiaceae bacterium]MCX7901095.1 3-deoxy-manno-octulosonate cytidylyltransferase [Burkholderiaceae bacterium]MDW8430512.1 3-deoxy-manno-octulosonate cytidylyltransferase [Sutterellaceae bacterium]
MTNFVALIPARLGSTRLPRKPLLDIGGAPMVVRVAQRAQAAGAARVVVATDSEDIVAACAQHRVEALLTSSAHETGTDRLAEAFARLALPDATIVVNVQGDEPLIPSRVITEVAALLATRPDCAIATAAHPLADADEFFNPNVVKVVLDQDNRALYFSRAPIPWAREAFAADRTRLPPALPAYRHVGLYAYRGTFLRAYPRLPRAPIECFESLEQLRALAAGYRIAVLTLARPLPPSVDTADQLQAVRAAYGLAAES